MVFPGKVKKTAVCLLAALLAAVVCHTFAAYAQTSPCSLVVMPKTSSGEAASGGIVSLLRVDEPAENADAQRLARYAEEHALFERTAAIGGDGAARFEDLPEGLWLVVQTEASDGCAPFAPFLLELPFRSDSGTLRGVIAEPKLSPVPEDPVPPPHSDTELPYTGQLRWPIPVLAVCGVVFIGASAVLRKGARSE